MRVVALGSSTMGKSTLLCCHSIPIFHGIWPLVVKGDCCIYVTLEVMIKYCESILPQLVIYFILFYLENRGIIHKLRAHEDVIGFTLSQLSLVSLLIPKKYLRIYITSFGALRKEIYLFGKMKKTKHIWRLRVEIKLLKSGPLTKGNVSSNQNFLAILECIVLGLLKMTNV
jgi:hypothetical protein